MLQPTAILRRCNYMDGCSTTFDGIAYAIAMPGTEANLLQRMLDKHGLHTPALHSVDGTIPLGTCSGMPYVNTMGTCDVCSNSNGIGTVTYDPITRSLIVTP